jgi:DeoR/GlpR family transcriptional regulator of sugar metabolism
VGDGEAIVLDSSTTAWHMARHLLARRDLTVLTTGLYVALELLRAPGLSVIIPGGPIWREAASVISAGGEEEGAPLPRTGNLQRGFFGGRGLTLADGLTDAIPNEAALKRRLVAAVREVNVVLDASKLGKVAFAPCAALEEIDRLITDRDASPDLVAALRARGIEVVLA